MLNWSDIKIITEIYLKFPILINFLFELERRTKTCCYYYQYGANKTPTSGALISPAN